MKHIALFYACTISLLVLCFIYAYIKTRIQPKKTSSKKTNPELTKNNLPEETLAEMEKMVTQAEKMIEESQDAMPIGFNNLIDQLGKKNELIQTLSIGLSPENDAKIAQRIMTMNAKIRELVIIRLKKGGIIK